MTNYHLLRGIWEVLNNKRKKQFLLCSFLILFSGITEALSIGSIIPLIRYLISPKEFESNTLIKSIISSLAFIKLEEPIIAIVILFVVSILIAGFFRILTLWIISKFISALASDFSFESYRRNLYQPYSVHVRKNSSHIVALNTVEINRLSLIFTSFMKMLLSISYVIFIVTAVFIYDLKLGISSLLVFIIVYFLLISLSKFYLRRNSKIISKSINKEVKFLNEGFGSIREIILNNNYKFYLKNFFKIDKPMRSKMAENDFITTAPKALVESVAFIYLSFLSLYIVITESNSSLLLSRIAVIAIACQKILPQLQQIYASWTRLSGNSKSVEKILNSINQPINISNKFKKELIFKEEIYLKNIYFKYEDATKYALKDINLKIKKAEKIGIIGETGTGKSTLIDLIVGLLNPTKGSIYLDKNKSISNNEEIYSWRSIISYIPQNIYLSDTSIIENIACGKEKDKIDRRKVIKSSKKAQIHNFIESLPMGYDTEVGEMGIKLSGGQRQRIGIARAIFNILDKNKQILVLDEATSALDLETENSIINALYNLDKNLTLIMISHRHNTLVNCDRIIEMKNGSIISSRNINL